MILSQNKRCKVYRIKMILQVFTKWFMSNVCNVCILCGWQNGKAPTILDFTTALLIYKDVAKMNSADSRQRSLDLQLIEMPLSEQACAYAATTSQKHAQSPTDGHEHAASTHISTYGSASTWRQTGGWKDMECNRASSMTFVLHTWVLHSLKRGPDINRQDCSTVTNFIMLSLQGRGIWTCKKTYICSISHINLLLSICLVQIFKII